MFLEAETTFGLNVLRTHPLNESLVFSPISIALALSLLHTGANENARQQIAETIAKGASDDQLLQHYSFITELLNTAERNVSSVVQNKFYSSNRSKFKQSYLDKVEKYYNVSSENPPANADENTTLSEINSHISTISALTALSTEIDSEGEEAKESLVNQMELSVNWNERLNLRKTSLEGFSLGENTKKLVEFLNADFDYRDYAEDKLFEVLSLNYSDPSYAFAIFLPKKHLGLVEALQMLTPAHFQQLLGDRKLSFLQIKFPKFKIEKTLNLSSALTELNVFKSSAQYSGVAENFNLTDVVHNASFEVRESEKDSLRPTAYPAMEKITDSQVLVGGAIVFQADHPFLFALLKDKHPVFLGIYS